MLPVYLDMNVGELGIGHPLEVSLPADWALRCKLERLDRNRLGRFPTLFSPRYRQQHLTALREMISTRQHQHMSKSPRVFSLALQLKFSWSLNDDVGFPPQCRPIRHMRDNVEAGYQSCRATASWTRFQFALLRAKRLRRRHQ